MTRRIRERDGDVVAATAAMYACLGDRAGFDAHLHQDVTIWETDQPEDLMGLVGLNALRDQRAGAAPAEPTEPTQPPVVEVRDAVVDRWGEEVAVIRYVLHATDSDGESSYRVTDVLVNEEQGWRVVHHHAEHMAPVAAG